MNKFGQLKIPYYPKKIVKVACGMQHNLFLTTEKFVIGSGLDTLGRISIPDIVQGIADDISCGAAHSTILFNKQVVCLGANDKGQCNVNDSIQGDIHSINSGYFFNIFLVNLKY